MHGRLGIHVCGTWIWMACTHATQGHGCVYNPPTHTRRLALVRFRSHAIKSISLQKAGAQALFRILSAFPSLPPSLHPPTTGPHPSACIHAGFSSFPLYSRGLLAPCLQVPSDAFDEVVHGVLELGDVGGIDSIGAKDEPELGLEKGAVRAQATHNAARALVAGVRVDGPCLRNLRHERAKPCDAPLEVGCS